MAKKLLIVGDCHCSSKTLKDVEYAFKQITKTIKKFSVDVICLAGDIFDLHANIKSESLNFFIAYMRRWLNKFSDLKIILIVGNHDFINNNIYCTDQHFLNSFKEWERVTVVDYPQEYQIGESRLALFPYIPEGRYFEAHQEYLDGSFDFNLFISHQTFRGGKMDNGIPSETSDVWAPNYPQQISGHLHTPHQVADNLIYIGSLIHCKHSEEGVKRLLLVELDKKELDISEIELKPLEIYETIHFDIRTDDIKTVKQGDKIRYHISGGTAGEMVAYVQQHKKIFKGKVSYETNGTTNKLDFINDAVDPLEELKAAINPKLLGELEISETSQGKYTLPPPSGSLTLIIDDYIQVKNRKIKIKSGLTALRGDNGVGKTSTLNSIEWLLYGGNSPDGNKTSVSLRNGKVWIIKRISKPKQLTLEVDGETYFDENAQDIINNTFGSKIIWNTISYLEQKKYCNFFSYSDNDKREFLSQIFHRSGVIRNVYLALAAKAKTSQAKLELAENAYQNLIDLIGEEEEDLPILDLTGLEEIAEELMFEVPKPDLPSFPTPHPLYLDDLQEPEKPKLDHLEPLEKPKDPPRPKLEPVYLDDLKNPIRPDTKHCEDLDPPKLKTLYLDDLQEPPQPKFEKLDSPDLSLWEEVEIPKYSIEKAKRKLEKARELLRINQENEIKRKRRKTLKCKLKDTTEANRMLKLQEILEELQDVPPQSFTKEEIRELQRQISNEELKELYRRTYQREPNKNRIEELDIAFKFNDALETKCPGCEVELLALVSRKRSIELVISEGQKTSELPDDEERKLLLQINFSLPIPSMSLEEAQKRQKKFDVLQEYIPGDYKSIIEEQLNLQAEIKLLKIEEVEEVTAEDVDNIQKQLDCFYEYEQIKKENERKKNERQRALKQWEIENQKRHHALVEQWEKTCEKIREEIKERKNNWEQEKEALLTTWRDENKRRQEERARLLHNWKNQCEKIEEVKNARLTEWQKKNDELTSAWEEEKKQLLAQWKHENKRRQDESKQILNEWKEQCLKIKQEKEKRKQKWKHEKEKLIAEWEERTKELIAKWEQENTRRKKLRRENEHRKIERVRRTEEHQKQVDRITKQNEKRILHQQQRESERNNLAELKDALKICKDLETKYFLQQLDMFNVVFEGVISNIFTGAVGRISPTKENKTGTLSDRITLDIWIGDTRRTDLKTLSAGESDLISLAFQIALISITPTPFKLILLDEPLSQLHKDRIHSVADVLEEYLGIYHCLIVVHDEGVLNDNEIYLTKS